MILGLTYAFFASQILAGIAIISDIFSFQFKERKKIIIFFMISSFCIGLHYFFLGRYVPAMISIPAIIRFFISYHSHNKYWILFFTPIFITITYVFYADIYDLLVLGASTLATIAVFQKNDRFLRLFMMSATVCFILYNFIVFSPVGVLLESIFLGSNLIGYYRHYIKKRLS